MAWVKEYDMAWVGNHAAGTIELQRDGGSYVRSLKLVKDSLSIVNSIPNWESPIMRSNCSFAIQNDFTTFYDALPLMTISNGQYRVVVEMTTPGAAELFVGYLNCETVSQVMVDYQNIQLTASGLIRKLENDHPVCVDTVQDLSLIDIIDECLRMTGSTYNIRVSCSLYETSNAISPTTTLFNLIGINTEVFWENNKDRDSSLDILKKILIPFHCFLYWYQGYWYIEHYEDLGSSNKDWVEYTTGTSGGYNYANAGADVGAAASWLTMHAKTTYQQIGEQQLLSVMPGLKQYDIKLAQKQYFNLFNEDLTAHPMGLAAIDLYYPPLRSWYGWKDGASDWLFKGSPYLTITNSTYRDFYDLLANDGYYNGLTTRFMVTISEDTELTITFKVAIPYGVVGAAGAAADPEEYTWGQYWFLKTGLNGYFWKSTISGEWEYNYPGSLANGSRFECPATDFDFDNPVAAVKEITLTIPIGQAYADTMGTSAMPIEVDLVFRAGLDIWLHDSVGSLTSWQQVYGDFHSAVTDAPDDNLLEGDITTDFLDKKKVTLELFDTQSWNYRNSLLYEGTDDYGATWFNKTTLWSWGSGAVTLARRLMESKFRLYRIARQIIKIAYIFYDTSASWTLRPLILFLDNKQSNKKFVMLEDRHLPESDTHEVQLFEYDDTETITLV